MRSRAVAAMLLAPGVGVGCFLAPILLSGGTEALAEPESLNVISRVFENFKPIPTTILLVLAGFGLRYLAGRGTWILALLLVAVFPVATVFGVMTRPEQHNLLPFELATELACAAPALLGTLVASVLAKRRQEP